MEIFKYELRTDTRGKVLAHVARLGNLAAEAPTKAKAKSKLTQKLARFCEEFAVPKVRFQDDGAVMVAWRASHGGWVISRFWRSNLFPGETIGACTANFSGEGAREAALALLEQQSPKVTD